MTGVIVLVSYLVDPAGWIGSIETVRASSSTPQTVGAGTCRSRSSYGCPIALVVAGIASVTGRAWLLPVAVTLALPVLWLNSLAILVASVTLWRARVGSRVEARAFDLAALRAVRLVMVISRTPGVRTLWPRL